MALSDAAPPAPEPDQPPATKPRAQARHDPGHYRAMSVPHPNRAAAEAAHRGFCEAVEAARLRFRIKNVTVLTRIAVLEDDAEPPAAGDEVEVVGSETEFATRLHLGDSLVLLPMLAEAYGSVRQQTEDGLDRLAAGTRAARTRRTP